MAKILNKKVLIPALPLKRCIAKTKEDGSPGMTVKKHGKIAGEVAKIFRRVISSFVRKRLIPNIASLAAMHDIGKASLWQKRIYKEYLETISPELFKIPDECFEKYHAVISEASFKDAFHGTANPDIIKQYASIIGSHHGRRTQEPFGSTIDAYGGVNWEFLRQELIKYYIKEFGYPIFRPLSQEVADINTAYISLCDWIASDTNMFRASGNIKNLHKQILKAIRALGWKKSVIRKNLKFKDIFDFNPYEMQKKFYSSVNGPGVYILESSMGDGKTEAALFATYRLLCEGHHEGFYFALPTRITSNRIYERIDKFLTNAYEKGMAPKLIHGMSLISDVKSKGEFAPGGQFFNTNRKAPLLPFGIGTVDQLLLSLVKSKYNFIRTFGFAGKVIIIDEVHSYDVYTGRLLDQLIKKLRKLGCTVIILSATLTHKRKAELLDCKIKPTNNYPLLTSKRKKLSIKKCGTMTEKPYLVRKMTANYPYLISTMKKRALSNHQALWICNLVDRSVAIYRALRDDPQLKGIKMGVLHSRIPHIIKNKREKCWIERLGKGKDGNRKEGSILIGTQVLEQSIDIDGDFMISDLAPSDLLLQRLGRLWRHLFKRPSDRAEFWISCPNLLGVQSAKELRERLGIDSKIYSAYVLWRSFQVFRRRGTIIVPTDIRAILESTYRDYSYNDPKWLQEIWDNLQKSKEHLKDLASITIGSHMDFFNEDTEDLFPLDVTEEASIRTRMGTIPYATLLLTSSVEDKGDYVDVEFLNGDKVSSPKNRRDFTVIKKITEWLVKAPVTKALKDLESPKWLKKVSYGFPIPVYVDEDCSVKLCDNGEQTGYYYEEDCGMYKPVEL